MAQKIINAFLLAVLLLPFSAQAASISDKIEGGAKEAVNEAYGGGDNVTIQTEFPGPLTIALIGIVNSLLVFLGAMFMLMALYGGWLWMTARGNDAQIDKAKQVIRGAVIGFIIIFFSRIITELILTLIGQSVTAPQ